MPCCSQEFLVNIGDIFSYDEHAYACNFNDPFGIMPIHRVFTIRYRNFLKEQVSATLYNPAGKAVCTSGLINAEALNGKQVLVNQFAGGLYYLKIVNSNGVVVGNMKIVVAK